MSSDSGGINPSVPSLKIKDLNISDFKNVKVVGTVDRPYGRKFKLVLTDSGGNILKETEEMAFKDLFPKVKKITKKELAKDGGPGLESLATLDRFLKDLDAQEALMTKQSERKKDKSVAYRILTFFSRLFTFGSHHKRIEKLQKKVENVIKITPMVNSDLELTANIDQLLAEGKIGAATMETNKIRHLDLKKFYESEIKALRTERSKGIAPISPFPSSTPPPNAFILANKPRKVPSNDISQEEWQSKLEEILSKNTNERPIYMIGQPSDLNKKNEFIEKFIDKYIAEKKFEEAKKVLTLCTDTDLHNQLNQKIDSANFQ